MRKSLLALLVVTLTTTAVAKSVDPTVMKANFQPTDDTLPINPDEAAVSLVQRDDWAVFRLATTVNACTGIVVANTRTKHYQRLTDISCDDGVTYANISQTRRVGVYAIDFFNEAELIGRMTVKR